MDPFGHPASHPDERWFFINGIGTNLDVARMNTRKLAKVHQRPITGIYNRTCSVLLDLWECLDGMVDKTEPMFDQSASMTAPDYVAAHAVFAALADESVKRVVLIAHSQGTIIAANVLKALLLVFKTLEAEEVEEPNREAISRENGNVCLRELAYRCVIPSCLRQQPREQQVEYIIHVLSKLELQLYATCAPEIHFLTVAPPSTEKPANLPKLITLYANEQDVIAQMSAMRDQGTGIEGQIINIADTGHLLNTCYLGRDT